jgi:hypothetical protein
MVSLNRYLESRSFGLEDSLKIEVNQKTYGFEAISGKNDRDRKTATRELHELLSSRLQEARL